MTLPSSGTLDFNSIRAEFGSPSSNVYLSLYYRGGPYTYPDPANAKSEALYPPSFNELLAVPQ